MSYTYWLHEKIQADFNDGFAWYENKKKGLGFEFLNEIEVTINKIVAQPGSFGSKGNLRYREASLKRFPYVIVYRIYPRKNEIFISALHHTSKSPRKKYRYP